MWKCWRGVTEVSEVDNGQYLENARSWLAEHAPAFSGQARVGLSVQQDLELGRAWQRLKAEHGYAGITMPQQYGGGGGSEIQKIIFANEQNKYDLPTEYFGVSLGMPVPMLLKYASDEVLQRLVPPAIRGEQIWCQLFSEPAAGSDLAALKLKATREGDGWILEGQKLWTTWAQYSDWGIIVTRTDPTVAKHAGLTYFYVDMKAPGVEVRTIRKLAGESEINEVFFDRVYVPDEQRMGEIGGGFRVALETLMIERYAVSDEACGGIGLDKFLEIARHSTINGQPAMEDGEVRRMIADTVAERQGLRSIHRRAMDAIAVGREPGPEGAIRKLLTASRRQQLSAVAMDLMGIDGLLLPENVQPSEQAAQSWIEAPPLRVAGGTDEILRNTIAERVLGLPQDHRPDKGIPFNQQG
jgi:alkylation response protein AidB-like acyl-CoA dehydrogenase